MQCSDKLLLLKSKSFAKMGSDFFDLMDSENKIFNYGFPLGSTRRYFVCTLIQVVGMILSLVAFVIFGIVTSLYSLSVQGYNELKSRYTVGLQKYKTDFSSHTTAYEDSH